MDMTPFIDIEDAGTLVMRPYSKGIKTGNHDICDVLVSAWSGSSPLWMRVLTEVVDTMNADLAEENE